MPSHYDGTREEVRALNAYIALVRAAETVTRPTTGPMAEHDLTISQFGVLEALYHLGPLAQHDLVEKILRTSGNVTLVCVNLEKRKLVARRRDPEDRRAVRVELTGAGRSLVKKVLPRVVASIVAGLGAISATEQEDLRRLARKLGLGSALRQRAGGREFVQR